MVGSSQLHGYIGRHMHMGWRKGVRAPLRQQILRRRAVLTINHARNTESSLSLALMHYFSVLPDLALSSRYRGGAT